MTELQPYRPRSARGAIGAQTPVAWEEQTITGQRKAVDAELARIDRAGQLVSRTGAVPQGRGVVSVKIRRVPIDLEHPLAVRDGRHPGWTVAILLSATALVGACSWAVLAIVSAIAAVGTLVLGVLVVAGAAVVLPKMVGGDRFSQTMNVWKR